MLNLDKFKQRVKERCAQTGVSQAFLCEKVGRQRTYLNNIWRGTTTPSDDDMQQFAALLSTTPAYLRGETDDPTAADAEADFMAEIKISPIKLELMKKIAAMSDTHAAVLDGLSGLDVDDLLKLEKIMDMILEEK